MLNHPLRYEFVDIPPMRYFEVRISRAAFPQFEAQMVRFAERFSFENKSRQMSENSYDIFFVFDRNDIELVSSNNSLDGMESEEEMKLGFKFSIGFYPQHDRAPPPKENVDVLVEGLKTFLAPAGVTLTDITSTRR